LLLLGHRGAFRYAAENTLTAFDLALAHGCDGFEFDVRRTADGQAVICHDERYRDRKIASSSYESLSPTGELLCLQHVLARYANRSFLYIELKDNGLEGVVLDALRDCPPERGYVVASFLPNVLEQLHALNSKVPLGLIARYSRQLERWRQSPVQYVMPKYSLVSPQTLELLHSAGKTVFVWTVNSQRQMRALSAAGADGMLSDDTDLLCRTFGRHAGQGGRISS